MDATIQRDTYPNPFGDGDIRVYTKTRLDGTKIHMPSVTTVLETRDDDKGGLYAWQDRNDGVGDNAYHEHLFWYSRHLGTLGHWHAMSELGDLDWTVDEAESAWVINNINTITDDSNYTAYSERLGRVFVVDGSNHTEIHDATPRQVLYSIYKSQHGVETWGEFFDVHSPYQGHDYYNGAVLEQADRDISFFRAAQQRMWRKLDVNTDSVIALEQFLFNEDERYAGQVDLVYEDPNGHIVVADLKSSSGCYDKHQMQGAAYGKAIENADGVDVESVDRLEVHRAHPRSGQMAVHTHDDAPGQQPIHTTQYWDDGYEEQWNAFSSLTDNFAEIDFESLVDDQNDIVTAERP